ncbi:carbohydrate-binding module family 20 domain-containing protein [uncultured Draconibacterium sp.]|uniref:carbohydrate-binding module family 20 domain-containing protein n=1 Tax=uncultured Draconibacterium sp. TaxID=1573823 RepID=UPI002AA8356A|nr:carbohydrate-binding module family 20 domain-containing protein [uncultured Draconibacterium sp.]
MKTQLLLLLLFISCITNAQTVNVTFRVDMQNETTETVFLSGSFCSWTPEEAVQLSASESVYSASLQLTPGDTVQYKFINGQPQLWEQYELLNGLECGYGPDDNRMVVVPETDTVLPLVCFATCSTCISWYAPQLSIRTIQGEGDVTPYLDQDIKTEGVITAINEYGAYIQDTSDFRSGLWVFSPGLNNQYSIGQDVHFIATATEYNGLTQLYNVQFYQNAGTAYTATPLNLQLTDIGEDSEGVLVKLSNVEVINTTNYGEYVVQNEGGDTLVISTYFFSPDLEIGSFYNITGVVDYRYNAFSLAPRDNNDLQNLTHPSVDVTFSVDMKNEDVSNDSVLIRGDWTNWQEPILLSANGTIYSTTITLHIGETYQYKFLNGTENWETIPDASCTAPGNDNRIITVTDTTSSLPLVCYGECSTCISWYAPQVSIRAIQGEGDVTPYLDQDVKTEGVITAISQDGVYIQDTTDIRSGIWVYEPDLINHYSVGNAVHFIAIAEEYNGRTSLNQVQFHQFTENPYWVNPINIDAWQMNEDYEGVLVRLNDVEVADIDQYGQYIIVDPYLDTTLIDFSFFEPTLEIGQRYNIAGVVHYRFNSFRLCPRGDDDIEKVTTDVTFSVDMKNEDVSNDSVLIRGDWTNWQEPILLSANGTIYSTTISLRVGETYQYKFLNGTENWETIPDASCTAPGNDNRIITVTDTTSALPLVCYGECSTCISWYAPQVSIRAIQGEGDVTPYLDQDVKTEGVITAINEYGAYIQDTSDFRSGLWVFSPGLNNQYSIGQDVHFIATATEYNGLTQLYNVQFYQNAGTAYTATPLNLQLTDIGEDSEGVLVKLSNVEVINTTNYSEYVVQNEGGDTLVISTYFFSPDLEIGSFYNITGVVDYRYNAFSLAPRDNNDLQNLTHPSVDVTFSVDMKNEDVSNDSVLIRGDWTNWQEPILLSANGTIYSTTITLHIGETYQYKFLNGTENWETIPDASCTAPGNDNRIITVTDTTSSLPLVCYGECSTCISWYAPQVSIRAIQGEGDVTPYLDQDVKTEGVITAISQDGVYIQDTTDIRSGIWVYEPDLINHYSVGNAVHFIAIAEEYNGRTSLNQVQFHQFTENPYWVNPINIDAWQMNEDYEGVLVRLNDVEVADIDQYGQYIIVDPYLDTTLIDFSFFEPTLEIGQRYNIAGVVHYRFNSFRLCPRGDGDVEKVTTDVTFSVDMKNETVSNDSVFLRGSWNDWNPQQLSKSGTIYSGTVTLRKGEEHQYKFTNGVDGWETIPIGNCIVLNSGNRLLNVPDNDTILPVTCFSYCANCDQYNAPYMAIQEIQGSGDITPYEGQLVKTAGKIMAINEYGAFLQDSTGARNGIFIYDTTLTNYYSTGNLIEVVATATEYNGMTELKDIVNIDWTDEYFGIYASYIDASAVGEDYESVFVGLSNMEAIGIDQYNQNLVVSETNDTVIIDNYLYQPTLEVGKHYNIFGIVNYRYDTYRVCPRAAGGIQEILPSANVTFQVDMKNQLLTGDGVYISGSFCNWSPAEAVELAASESVYSATVNLTVGDTIQYKFINGAPDQWAQYEIINGLDCAYGNDANRMIIIPENDTILDLVCFAQCAPCTEPPLLAINEIQGNGDVSPYVGQPVTTTGKIMATNQYGAFIQDDTGARNGIFVYDTTLVKTYTQGDFITLTAYTDEYNGLTELKDVLAVDYSADQPIVGTAYIDASWIGEDYESVFVGLSNMEVIEQDEYNQYITVSEAGDTVIIDNYLYEPTMEVGAFYDIWGVETYRYNTYRISPRAAGGLQRRPDKVTVTFRVNMQEELAADSVLVRGSWDNWSQSVPLTNSGTIYSAQLSIEEGSYIEYKFINGETYEDFIAECTEPQNNNRYFTTPSQDTTLGLVCFNSCSNCPPIYAVSTNAVPAAGGSTSGGGSYTEGDTVTVSASATEPYVFTNWTVNGSVVSTSADYEFVVSSNIYVQANFTIPTVQVTFAVDMQHETVDQQGVFLRGSWDNWQQTITLSNAGSLYSATIPLTVGATFQYKFMNGSTYEDFTGDCTVGETNNRQLAVPASNYSLPTVCFNHCTVCPPEYQITAEVNPANAGTVIGAGFYIEGETVELKAVANADFYFENWTNGDSVVSSDTVYSFIATEETALMANFVAIPPSVEITFAVDMANDTLSNDGIFIMGSWNNWSTPTELSANGAVYSTTLELLCDSLYEYKFMNGNTWENFVADCTTGDSNNRYLTVPLQDSTLATVCFNSCLACTNFYEVVTISDSEQGTTSGEGTYEAGESVTISAVAADGYSFVSWTTGDSVVSVNAEYTFMAEEDITLTANFEVVIPTYSATFAVDMQNELVSDSGVYIVGSWNNWTDATLLNNESAFVYTATVALEDNASYEYKFVNGESSNPNNFEAPTGAQVNQETGNRMLVIDSTDVVVPLVCFNQSVACATNEPPVAYSQSFSLLEDSVISFSLQAIDAEDAIEDLVFTIETAPQNSVEFIQDSNRITYRPQADFYGTDDLTFSVSDSEGSVSQTATVTLTVEAVNDRPVAQSSTIDAQNTSPVPFSLGALISDNETADNNLDITFVPAMSSVLGGTVSALANQSYSFTASNPETNEDYLVYRVSDGELTSYAEVLTLTNLNSDKSLQIPDEENSLLTVDDEASLRYGQTIGLEFIGIDKTYPFEQLQVSIIKQPEHGTLSNFGLNAYSGSILTTYRARYTATDNSNVRDSVVFKVSNNNETITGVYYLNVGALKMPPSLLAVANQTMNEGSTLSIDLSVTDMDTELEDLSWTFTSMPAIAAEYKLSIENGMPLLSITPPANYSGNFMVKAKVTDTDELSDEVLFPVAVANINNAPVPHFDNTVQALEDTLFSYILRAEDYDKDSLSFVLANLPDWLSYQVLSKYTVELYGTPDNADVGTSEINIQLSDGLSTVLDSLWLEVVNVNDKPVAIAEFDTVYARAGDDMISYTLSDYFYDEDSGAVFSFSLVSAGNTNISQPEINGNLLELSFNSDSVGTTQVTFYAISQGDTLSQTIVVVVDTKVGVGTIDRMPEFSVYPNPVSDHFTVSFGDGNQDWQIQIMDMNGRLILQRPISMQREVRFESTPFKAAGNYLIRVTYNNAAKTKKIIAH